MKTQKTKGKYVQIDKYVFDQQRSLGEGACGKVYLGFVAMAQEDENNVVAIKEIPVKANHDITDSILQEVNVLRKVKHRNIVSFIDAKMNDDFMYLVTQFCNQGTIEDLIFSKQLSEEEVLGYISQIAEGFKYIRYKKIVHRDIKPQNILLHNGVVKIADFGLAKVVDPASQNRFQTFSGTPLFMSPQIIKQESYSDLADIWSLGVTFYFMFFRQYPWNEANPLKLLKRIESKVKDLYPEGTTLSESTKDLLRRMLTVEEKDRLTWDEFFNHKAITGEQSEIEQSAQFYTETIEDLTVNNFRLKSSSNYSDEKIEEIQEYGRRQTFVYEKNQNALLCARRARDHLEFERQSGLFLIQVAKELESQKKINNSIPEDLYVKCIFLLFKRIYALFLNLNQMLMFETNSSGIIEIEEKDWKSLMSSVQLRSDLNKMRTTVVKDYEYARKEFSKQKELLYDAQMKLSSFTLIERGDAYKDNVIEENENLILAFNDNFLKLFLLLAKDLEAIYLQALEEQIQISKNQIFNEKKIDFVFVYDLIIVLSFRNVVKKSPLDSNQPLNNFHKYYEDRKRIDPNKILHKIQKQKIAWAKILQ